MRRHYPLPVSFFLLLVFAPIASSVGSTFSVSGNVTAVRAGSGGAIVELDARVTYINYTSNTSEAVGMLADSAVIPGTKTTSVHGKLVSNDTFKRALESFGLGKPLTMYETTHLDLGLEDPPVGGILKAVNGSQNAITIEDHLTNRSFHFVDNPARQLDVNLAPDTEFLLDGETSISKNEALGVLGRWVQTHPPRDQIVWVETAVSDYDWSILYHPTEGRRGYANSWTGDAVFLGYTPDNKIQFRVNREGTWVTDTMDVGGAKAGLTLDLKVVPNYVALKPGRHFIANYYRTETIPHQRWFRTRDDEIRGVITAVGLDSITIAAKDWDGNPYTVEVARSSRGRFYLDGTATPFHAAVAVGRRVRVLPERVHQRVCLFNEYRPTTGGTGWLPIAYFDADTWYAEGATTFQFNGTHSYAPSPGESIVAWNWTFADGTTASGPVVTKLIDPASGYRNFGVTLTVTNNIGKTGSITHNVYVSPGMIRSAEIDPTQVSAGVMLQNWSNGALLNPAIYPSILSTVPDLFNGILTTWNSNNMNTTVGTLVRYTGYIRVPVTGMYELRADYLFDATPAADHGMRLVIGDQEVISIAATAKWSPYESLLNQRAWVRLEAGLHPFVYETNSRRSSARLGWDGPTLTGIPNPTIRALFVNPPAPPPLDPGKANQTISLTPVGDLLTTDPPVSLNTVASSGLPLSFTVVEGPASIAGSTLTLNGASGQVVVKASQAGNATVNPAPDVFEFITVQSPAQTIRFTVTDATNSAPVAGATVTVGSNSSLTDSAGVAELELPPGNFTYSVSRAPYATALGSVALSMSDVELAMSLSPAATPPVFLVSPQPVDLAVGESLTLSCVAEKVPTPTLQWHRDGLPIPGAVNSTYTLSSATLGDTGTYTVVATNTQGNATSAGAQVTVHTRSAPTFTLHPQSATRVDYTSHTFTSATAGYPSPTYQWFKVVGGGPDQALDDSEFLQGTKTANLTFPSLRTTDSGVYYVVATNSEGSVASQNATLTVNEQPPTALPQTVVTPVGAARSLTLQGTDPGGRSLSYHVLTPPGVGALSGSGANRTYTPLPGWSGTDTFTFKVNNGSLDSAPATVTILVTDQPLVWNGQPSSPVWDKVSPNWTGPTTVFADGGRVRFDNSAPSTNVTITGMVLPNTIEFIGSKNFTFSGGQLGSGNLVCNGTGTVLFNDYTTPLAFDSLEVRSGTFAYRLSNAQPVGNRVFSFGSVPIQLSNGATFSFRHANNDGITVTNDFVIGTGGGTINSQRSTANPVTLFPGTFTLEGNLKLSGGAGTGAPRRNFMGVMVLKGGERAIRANGSWTTNQYPRISANIVDEGAGSRLVLAMTQNSTLQITGTTNTYSSGTRIESGNGTIEVGASSRLGSGNLTVEAGGRLRLTAPTNIASSATLIVAGAVELANGTSVRVANLSLGKVAQSPGIYNATTSAPFIAGTGEIVVGPPIGTPPTITIQPTSVFVQPGQNATFNVTATGTGPLSYQWRKGGFELNDGEFVQGAETATLTLVAAEVGDAGTYDVVVSNSEGIVASIPARSR